MTATEAERRRAASEREICDDGATVSLSAVLLDLAVAGHWTTTRPGVHASECIGTMLRALVLQALLTWEVSP